MKTFFRSAGRALLLVIFNFAFSISNSPALDCTWNFTDFTSAALGIKQVTIQTIAPFGVSGNQIITGDIRGYGTGTNSSLTVTNMANGRSYRVRFIGDARVFGTNVVTTITNNFGTNVTGAVNAVDYLALPLVTDGAAVAYSQAAADGRFLRRTNDTGANMTFSGTFQSLGSTNYFAGDVRIGGLNLWFGTGLRLSDDGGGSLSVNAPFAAQSFSGNGASVTNISTNNIPGLNAMLAAGSGNPNGLTNNHSVPVTLKTSLAVTNSLVTGTNTAWPTNQFQVATPTKSKALAVDTNGNTYLEGTLTGPGGSGFLINSGPGGAQITFDVSDIHPTTAGAIALGRATHPYTDLFLNRLFRVTNSATGNYIEATNNSVFINNNVYFSRPNNNTVAIGIVGGGSFSHDGDTYGLNAANAKLFFGNSTPSQVGFRYAAISSSSATLTLQQADGVGQASMIVSNGAVTFSQMAEMPTNAILAAAANNTPWTAVNLTNVGPAFVKTNTTSASGGFTVDPIITSNSMRLMHVGTNLDYGTLKRFNLWLDYTNNYPMTVLAIGDSLAVSPSMSERVAVKLQERFGTNGYVSDSFLSTEPYATNSAATYDAGPGTSFDSGGTNWIGRYHALCGNGESVAYGSSVRPNGYYSDQVQVFWVSHAGGGTFDLQAMANGGAWTTIKSLTGLNAGRVGSYTNVAVSANYNRFRLINTEAKTNYIIWTAPYYSGFGASKIGAGAGVRFACIGYGGLSLDAWTNTPAAIKDVILTNLNPALVISHNLEEANPVEMQWLPEYFRWLNLTRYSADRVVALNYDFGYPLDPTNSYLERDLWYTNAVNNGLATYDLENWSGGFRNFFTNGFATSWANPHPNTAGQVAMADGFLQRFDLGRYWLASAKSPPSTLTLRVYGETNSPLRVFKSDASGSSSVNVGGEANVGYVAFNQDGSYLKAAVFGGASGTWLNSPSSTVGPYFQRGSGGTDLGKFVASGMLQTTYGFDTPQTATATNGYYLPTNAISAWPTTPRWHGEAYFGNSNGVVYLLTSVPGALTWAATNKIAP